MSKSRIITKSHHGWCKKCIKSSFYCLKSSLLIVPRERRSWKHTTAHNFPPHMLNIKKTSLNGTQHIRKLYIYFLFSLKVFYSLFFLRDKKGGDGGREKWKLNKTFESKWRWWGERTESPNKWKRACWTREKRLKWKHRRKQQKQITIFFCVHYLALFLLNCQDGIQSSKAQERIVERTMKTKLF